MITLIGSISDYDSLSKEQLFNELMFLTTPLIVNSSVGTGFFFAFHVNEKRHLSIITNKHIAGEGLKMTQLWFHHGKNHFEAIHLVKELKWYQHPSHDLSIAFIDGILEDLEKTGGVHLFYLHENNLPTEDFLRKLSPVENLLMIGYPGGKWETAHLLPIFRLGHTAYHPAIDYNNEGVGISDITASLGSSGSPVMIFDQGSYIDGNSLIVGSRLALLGVQSKSSTTPVLKRVVDMSGNATYVPIDELHTFMNLGIYVRFEKILDFKKVLEENIK